MQTILGSNGAIGREIAKSLKQYTDQIRLVSRNPIMVNDNDELFKADVKNKEEVMKAVEGSEVVYLTVGLKYDSKVWQKHWPVIMRNVIDACKVHQAKLVFFDNVYMYDPAYMGNITEDVPVNPVSKKGKVRAGIAQMLLNEVKDGNLKALIARCADFYGPNSNTSIPVIIVYKNLKKRKSANWIANANKIHTMTFTKDAGRATALLGNTEDAYNQVWHLPTDTSELTGKQWVDLFARQMDVQPRLSVLSKGMLRLLGWFSPIMKEIHEMAYQNDRDYFFNSSKFMNRFPEFNVTKPDEGVRQIIEEGA
ncbi:MAG: NAD-dependent epimerase/dehydratase family protein [Bacteroidetes bacterium]|jgi:nucleoside-diphosphate-sugar epimerase|nr:NAD-dependent epimerase/dehydratase family protein [Bacteroidota bacterium]